MENRPHGLYLLDVRGLDISDVSVLNELELARFNRFRFDKDKATFLYGRKLIRRFASKDEISYGFNKRPYFKDGPFFSLSHSYPYVALAVSSSPIGVDIESLDRLDKTPVTRYFAESEKEEFPELSKLWCYKEAIFKCYGDGYFDPKEPLHKDKDVFYFKGKPFFTCAHEREDFLLVAASTMPIALSIKEVKQEDLL